MVLSVCLLDTARIRVLLGTETFFLTLKPVCSHVEDADLWRWEHPESKLFHAGIGHMRLDFDIHRNKKLFSRLAHLDVNEVLALVSDFSAVMSLSQPETTCIQLQSAC